MSTLADERRVDSARRRALLAGHIKARQRGARRSGARHLAHALAAAGVTHAFVVTGNPIDGLIGDCARAGLRPIGARHQQAACLMSLAHNYVAGALRSVVIVSAGPAASNCATGVLFAHDNRWPLLVLAGRLPSTPDRPGAFQDFDAAGFHAPLLRAHARVDEPGAIEGALSHALAACMGDLPGPAWLDLTPDALERALADPSDLRAGGAAGATGATGASRPLPGRGSTVEDDRRGRAARLLAAAHRPVLLVGEDLRWSSPWRELRRFVDTLRIPFATTPLARGYLPERHPLDVTARRAAALAGADLVIQAGARADWTLRHGAEFPANVATLRIARGPDDACGRSRVATELVGNEAALLAALLEDVTRLGAAGEAAGRDEQWLAQVSLPSEAPAGSPTSRPAPVLGAGAHERGAALCARTWLDELATALPANAITVLDGSVAMTLAQQALPVAAPVTRLTPGRNGTMGVGVPFAIGAKTARPDLPVVLVSGDFAVGVNALELETAARHQVPIVVVVSNNEGINGALRQRAFLDPDHPERVLRFGPAVRHDALARALGAAGYRVDAPGEIALALEEALAGGVAACVDVATRDDDPAVAAI